MLGQTININKFVAPGGSATFYAFLLSNINSYSRLESGIPVPLMPLEENNIELSEFFLRFTRKERT
jgi:hypothetical protein